MERAYSMLSIRNLLSEPQSTSHTFRNSINDNTEMKMILIMWSGAAAVTMPGNPLPAATAF